MVFPRVGEITEAFVKNVALELDHERQLEFGLEEGNDRGWEAGI